MLVYGPCNERIVLFEPIMNILINSFLSMISLVLLFLGFKHNIFPLLMFILSILICHLSDILTKVSIVIMVPQHKIINTSFYQTLLSFLLWYIGSYILVMNIIISYSIMINIIGCFVTFGYGIIILMYLSAIENVQEYHFMPTSGIRINNNNELLQNK